VSVDILIEKLPAARGVFDVATRIMALVLFLLLGWSLLKMGAGYLRTGETTQTLLLPFYPIAFALGICAFAECIVLLSDIGRAVSKGARHE
jgi:TRAP-type C4-dicarboxylate transport system permease small subunit